MTKNTKIEITCHNGGKPTHIGSVVTDDDYAIATIDAWANDAGGLADLLAMAEEGSTVPADYELTGDECYEVMVSQ